MVQDEKIEKLECLRKKVRNDFEHIHSDFDKMSEINADMKKAANIAKQATIIIPDIERDFKRATKLDGKDVAFLMVSVGLQCFRQYVIGSLTERKKASEADKIPHKIQKKIWGNMDNDELDYWQVMGKKYYATREEIMGSTAVPYDVVGNSTKEFNVSGDGKGLSGNTHRFYTLGHDPLAGWLFGTANIMTNTLTNRYGMTFHVQMPNVVSTGGVDKTARMFEHFFKRSKEVPEDLAICLIKQGLHIMSDVYTPRGLQLAGVPDMNIKTARNISDYGLDLGGVIKTGAEASMAILFNRLIAMLHRLTMDTTVELEQRNYEVRTRKILLYSNLIATSSNVLAVGIMSGMGIVGHDTNVLKKAIKHMDIGGLIVTISRLCQDVSFIKNVQEEFMANQWYDYVWNELN